MKNIIIKPEAQKKGNKWMPDGMIQFHNGPNLTEHREYYEQEFDTKEEADAYFLEISRRKYQIIQ